MHNHVIIYDKFVTRPRDGYASNKFEFQQVRNNNIVINAITIGTPASYLESLQVVSIAVCRFTYWSD